METEDKLNVLFDYHVSLHNLVYSMFAERCPRQFEACSKRIDGLEENSAERDKRLQVIENRKWWNTAAAGIGGVIGGFVAITAKWLLDSKG
jgi:hypothetical protein